MVSTTSTHTIIEDRQFLSDLKRNNPSMQSLVFGPRPTFLPDTVLDGAAYDICVQREPEFVVRDVLRGLRDGRNWREVKGVSFRDAGGEVRVNEPYPLISNLDELPWPDRSFLPQGRRLLQPGGPALSPHHHHDLPRLPAPNAPSA